MTNDEIKQAAIRAIGPINDPPQLFIAVEQAIREVVFQTYEDCAVVAENYGSVEWDYPKQIAGDIRALKDSLNATPKGAIK